MAPTNILVADDELEIRQLVSEVLEEAGYAVEVVGDGLSALAAIRSRPPALALFDVAMPVMSGDEALQQLLAEGPPIPVILMTAGTNPDRFLGLGPAAVVAKPFDIANLLTAVAEALARGPALAPPPLVERAGLPGRLYVPG